MKEPTTSRQTRDRSRGQLRQLLIDLANDYDMLLISLDDTLRVRHAKTLEMHVGYVRKAMEAVDQYHVLKRALGPK